VTESTSPIYYTKWIFNENETIKLNPNKTLKLNVNGPFTSDIYKLNVSLDKTFFESDTKYFFVLNVSQSENEFSLAAQQNWTLMMNAPPKSK